MSKRRKLGIRFGRNKINGYTPTEDQMPVVVKSGGWHDIHAGDNRIAAPGVIPHPDQKRYPGILIMENDHESIVRWHNKGCQRTGRIKPEDIKFDKNGAPWCPTCFAENEARDPNWNAEKQQVTAYVTNPRDAHGDDRDNSANIAIIRQRRLEGRFKDPFPAGEDAKPKVTTDLSAFNTPDPQGNKPTPGDTIVTETEAIEGTNPPEMFGEF